MPFIGNKPSAVPLTSADITDGIITSAKIADGTIVNADINASAGIVSTKLSGSFGKLLQLQHTEISTTPSRSTGTTYEDISGLSVSITPSSASSKILISLTIGLVGFGATSSTSFKLVRTISGSSTDLGGHTASSRQMAWLRNFNSTDGNHGLGVSGDYYDTPNTTSAITYKIQWIAQQTTTYLNRTENDSDGSEVYKTRTNSRIIAMEIGA